MWRTITGLLTACKGIIFVSHVGGEESDSSDEEASGSDSDGSITSDGE